ncbi:MAG: GAF domain-containing protein, partial [Anaerolineae bacterium]
PDIVLRQILDLSCQALDAVEGSILLRQSDSEELTFAIIFGEDEEKLLGRTLTPGQGIAGWVLQHDEAVLINDVSSDPRFYEGIDELTGFQTQSLVCAPLRHRGEVIGIIEIVNKRRDDFTFQDLSLLEAIASVTAVALENARLYTKTQARAEELAMLNEIGLTLTSSLNSSAVVQNALELIRRLFQADAVSLLQPDPETSDLFFVRALLGGQSKEISQRLSAGEGLAGWSLTHRQPVLVEDAQRDPRYWSGGENELDYTPHAVMVVPLLIEGEAIGIIIVGSRTVGAFTSEDLQTLQALSSTLGVALENARLYEDLKRLLQERERAQAQLVHTEKMAALGRLIASLAHEINNPLQAVQGCLTLADEELMEVSFERDALQRYIDIADKEIDRISVILRRMRDFYRPARHQMETTDVHQVLASVLALTNKQLQHSGVSVEQDYMEQIPALWANPDHLKQVFLNLILNAIDAMPDGGILTVRTGVDTLHREEGRVPALRIDLADTGEGMDADTVSRLFEPFFTTKEDGTGLGLSISYGIIRAHEGEIEVQSQPGEGTIFIIRLPIEKGSQL